VVSEKLSCRLIIASRDIRSPYKIYSKIIYESNFIYIASTMKDSFSVVDGVCHLLVNVQGPYVRVAEGGKELTHPRSMVVLLKVADNDKQMPRSSATQDNSCFPGKTKNVACICGDSSKGGVRITPDFVFRTPV
jgi:hypothetical protein